MTILRNLAATLLLIPVLALRSFAQDAEPAYPEPLGETVSDFAQALNATEEGRISRMLAEIQDGTYARKWIEENEKGRPWFNARRREEQEHLIEKVGAELRQMMPFLKPVQIKPGE